MTVFQVLQREGIISFGRVNERRIMSLKLSRLIDIADAASNLADNVQRRSLASPYIHSASLGLGGSPAECAARNCRLRRIGDLARYAALYSDGVFIHNFFSDYSSTHGHPPDQDSVHFRKNIIDDVRVALSIRPLIEQGVITMFTPDILRSDQHLCADCLIEEIFGIESSHRFLKTFGALSQTYLDVLSAEAYFEAGHYCISCSAPEPFLEHGGVVLSTPSPSMLAKVPRVLARIDRGNYVQLSQHARKRLKIHQHLARSPMRSVIYHTAVANSLGTSLVTDRHLDIDILQSLSDDPASKDDNRAIAQHMQAVVPFAVDVPIDKLIVLRRREEDAFIRFQAAIHRSIEAVRSQKGKFTERDARELYGDMIRPRVAELDQKVQEARRSLIRRPLASGAGITAVLGFGFLSGLLTAEFGAVASALGLYKVVNDVTVNTIELADTRKAIRNDDMYFLWRVQRMTKAN